MLRRYFLTSLTGLLLAATLVPGWAQEVVPLPLPTNTTSETPKEVKLPNPPQTVQPDADRASAQVINQVPQKPQGLGIYVNDYAGFLTASDKALLQNNLQALDEAGFAQMSVLILPDTERDLSEFAHVIMNQWDIQHYKKRNGLLILVNAHRVKNNLSGNRIYVGVGYALEEVFPDAVVGRILDEQAIPRFETGDFSGGVTQTALTIAKILAGDKELQAAYSEPEEEFDWIFGLMILLFLLIAFFTRSRRYHRGDFYGGGGGFYGGGGGFSGGFGGGGGASGGGGAGR